MRLAQGLVHPAGLAVCGREVYWTETRPPLVPHARHLPPTQARVVLRSISLGGPSAPRNLASLGGGAAEFTGELLGSDGTRVYLMEAVGQDCGPGWTICRSVPADGGPPETVVCERGRQTGRLVGGTLFWTAPSEDAGSPLRFRCLRRGSLPRPADALARPPVETLTDWLPADGRLGEVGGRLCYGSGEGVWLVRKRRALPEPVTSRPTLRTLVVGFGGAVYAVQMKKKSETIVRRPVTLAARLRAGLRLR